MNGSSIQVKHGIEGPSHDRCGYQEITVIRGDGRKATIHLGLATWMTYWDGARTREFDDDAPVLINKFEAVMGITPDQAARADYHLYERHMRRHHKHDLKWQPGFPGEYLLWCYTCGTAIDSCFKRSEIE